MQTVTRTIYGDFLQTCKLLNKPYPILPNTTLNHKFNIFPNELPNQGQYPSLGYMAIGNKGSSYEVTSDGYVLTTPIPHSVRDAGLFNYLPFVIRPVADDLSETERRNYRMRVPVSYNNVNYVAYYLKVLPLTNVSPTIQVRTVNGNTITATEFTPNVTDLSPIPPILSNVNLNTPNGDYLAVTAPFSVTLSTQDVNEITNACNIIYGDVRYAVLNEVALVTGIDRQLVSPTGVSYTEAVCSQIISFISIYSALNQNSSGVEFDFDIGGVEILSLSSTP